MNELSPKVQAPQALLDEFKSAYHYFNGAAVQRLQALYAEQIRFTDPVHTLVGWPALERYFLASARNLLHCEFVFVDEVLSAQSAFYKWEMRYAHRKIAAGAPLQLTGGTLLKFTDKINSHEDFYDLGALIYEKIPVLNCAVGAIKSRLAKQAY